MERPTAKGMTLKDGIDLSQAAAEDMELQNMPRFAEAVRLGREALKRLKLMRIHMLVLPLPGEIKEG